MSNPTNYKYSNTAESLLAHETSNQIKIDHLAFSFPLASLRHCASAGIANTKGKKKRSKYPQPPKFESFLASKVTDFDEYAKATQEAMIGFYTTTLSYWIHDVLHMELGNLRGKGFHGYTDSMELKANGVAVGYVGIGGQRNTVYFQISGTGCKHLFQHCTPFRLHHWLAKVFSVTNLGRIDLCYDDYDQNFDCNYAEKAYLDGAFRVSDRGQYPKIAPKHEYTINSDRQKLYSQEMIVVGSRTSQIYWRIYNKKLEQGIQDEKLSWYRTEVELKKFTVDVLLNPAASFAGLCAFAASIELDKGVRTKAMTKAKEACLDIAARVRHVRRSAGRALGDILEVFQGDIEKTIGLILPDDTGGKLGFPQTYQHLIQATETKL